MWIQGWCFNGYAFVVENTQLHFCFSSLPPSLHQQNLLRQTFSMATLNFNPTKFRDKTPFPKKPTSNFSLSSKPTKISYQLLPNSFLYLPSKPSSSLTPYSLPESSISSIPLETGADTADQGGEKVEEEDYDEEYDDPTAELCYLDPKSDPNTIYEWELDFCSRPILDIRGKKLWELVVCDDSLSLQYTKYFPNNIINSITLKNAIASISDELGIPLPEKIRYFRSQMQTIITRACSELGIKPIPSKRCLSLLLWLEERYETIYQRHPGFQKGAKPLMALDNPFPMDLPENLIGERWAFVQLPYSAVREEVSSLAEDFVFGAGLDFDLLGLEITDKTLIPGVAVASSRAKPLAAWMNGLEVCSIEADTDRASLVLSVGISTCYIYATYKKESVTTKEAEAWEAAKKASRGLHFLAIQEDLDSEDCVGFWLLLNLPPLSV